VFQSLPTIYPEISVEESSDHQQQYPPKKQKKRPRMERVKTAVVGESLSGTDREGGLQFLIHQNRHYDLVDHTRSPPRTKAVLSVLVLVLLGLLVASWTFVLAIVVGSGSLEPHIYAAYVTYGAALLADCIVAVTILVLASFFKQKLNTRAVACGLILAGFTTLVAAFVLRYTVDIYYENNKVPLSTWIISSTTGLLWIIVGLSFLEMPGNEVDGTLASIAEVDTEPFLTELV
jgi:hypothetical protein